MTLLLVVITGCVGELEGGLPARGRVGGDPGATPRTETPIPGRRIWRLTPTEYDNTVADLLGDTTHPASGWSPDGIANGFHNQASSLGLTETLGNQIARSAREVADRAVTSRFESLFPCGDGPDAACVDRFLRDLGLRAYRRPLADVEVAELTELFGEARTALDAQAGVQLVLETLLQSPSFLHRTELGIDGAAGPTVELDAYEVASALSYTLWDSMPDRALFALAADGSLLDPAVREREARRMLEDPRPRPAVPHFFLELLEYEALAFQRRDPGLFPEGDARIARMAEGTTRLVEHVVFDDEGTWSRLLTIPLTFADRTLAPVYGAEVATDTFEPIALDPGERGGLLTEAGVLAAHATADESAPPRRGRLVAQRMLCLTIPPPPPGVSQTVVVGERSTTRAAYEAVTSGPTCAGCHVTLNPLGFAFEHYDPMGQFRREDNGLPVDARVDLDDVHGLEGEIDGAVALGARLAASEEARSCFVRQTYRYLMGRAETDADTTTLATLVERFEESDTDVRDLVLAIVIADAFVNRTLED